MAEARFWAYQAGKEKIITPDEIPAIYERKLQDLRHLVDLDQRRLDILLAEQAARLQRQTSAAGDEPA